ncbi:probable disease resistance protein At4g27220 [Prosopis cineraria]|uniref:probable disease resistance protein At4g27220 n=1 Tax=Prosopis cineraria TaxID=364024 RepID=UPI0024101FE2|nr:probable disease resistance protein At4g27220 [Prosopis cineraria]
MQISEGITTYVAGSLVDKAMNELKYLCCYKSYVDDFEKEKPSLSATRNTVLKDIKDAEDKNKNQIEDDVQLWLDIAKGLIQEETKEKKKWFGLVTNCFWQYKRGKELEGKTQRIRQLIVERNNFTHIACSTESPDIKFYSSQNFMHFENTKLKFKQLKEACRLKDGKKFMIGLYGLGGTGKTTMAIEVGKEVVALKDFDKVIFSVVSKDPNLKKIRENIANQLGLPIDEKMGESKQAQSLWKRIFEGRENILIILDDMWKELTLQDIGIPPGYHDKGCCVVLLTTRQTTVCRDMGCHDNIKLEVLNEKDAMYLFLFYAGINIDGSSNDFEDVVASIVKECGGLPIAIVAMARALKSRSLNDLKDALVRLQNYVPTYSANEELKEAYNSLKLSYDYLKNEKAKNLFLLCSLFPEDYEIPIELLTRIAIGLGLCGDANKYFIARSEFTPIKNELIDSCLLLKSRNEIVKMHDLVREVALWIGKEQVQVGMDSNTTLDENIQYSS